MAKLIKAIRDRIYDFCLYAGAGEQKFKEALPYMQEQMRRDNKNYLGALSLLASFLYAAILGVSFFSESLANYRILYIVILAFCLLTWVFNRLLKYDNPYFLRTAVYVFVFSNYLFSIILGTVFSPNELASAYMAMLIAAPLVFVDQPVYFCLLNVGAYAVFIILANLFKNPACLVSDIANASLFTAFSIFSCMHSMNVKLQKYILENDNLRASETDILTGLKNRLCYEKDLQHCAARYGDDVFFLYLDVNGLHEINDSRGHNAGDEMLCFVAKEFMEAFGKSTYRIGGDEYVTFGRGLSQEEIESRIRVMHDRVEKAGYHTAIGYETGDAAPDMTTLVSLAEKKMYEAKAAYYNESGKDRRRRR